MTEIPDPYPVATLLRAAVAAHCQRTGDSAADVARAAGLEPPALSHACREGVNAAASTVRAVCQVLGLQVIFVPLGFDAFHDENKAPEPELGGRHAPDDDNDRETNVEAQLRKRQRDADQGPSAPGVRTEALQRDPRSTPVARTSGGDRVASRVASRRARGAVSPADFARWLYAIKDDRAKLSALRRSLQAEKGIAVLAMPLLEPRIPEDADPEPYYLIAALFAMHPTPGKSSVGDVYRAVIEAEPGGQRMYEDRFSRLLATSRESLLSPLRHAVATAKKHEIALDWARLLEDVIGWGDVEGRRRLASDCWRGGAQHSTCD